MVPRKLDDNGERRVSPTNHFSNPRLQPKTTRLHDIRNPRLRIICTVRLHTLLHRSPNTLQKRRKMGLVRHAGHRRHRLRRNDLHDRIHDIARHSQHSNDHNLDSWTSPSSQRNPQQTLLEKTLRQTLNHEGSLLLPPNNPGHLPTYIKGRHYSTELLPPQPRLHPP